MKIDYNESDNSIIIRDGLKNQYLILKVLMVLNILNAVIRLLNKRIESYAIIEYFWIGICLISLVILVMFFIKKSSARKIKVQKIKRLKEKTILGNKRFSLLLTSGKQRDIGNFKDEIELAKIKDLLLKAGIK